MTGLTYSKEQNELRIKTLLKVIAIQDVNQQIHWVPVVLTSKLKCNCLANCLAEYDLAEFKYKGHITVTPCDATHVDITTPVSDFVESTTLEHI